MDASAVSASLAKMCSRLESLPAELLLHVIGYIARPSDLKSLCLTSTEIRRPATTLLYKRIIFDKSIPNWASLMKPGTGMLSQSNAGLAQIRELTFRYHPKNKEATPVEVQTMTAVLKALPKNTLRLIECIGFVVDEDLATLLITEQRNIESLALGHLTFNLLPFIERSLLGPSIFVNVKDLDIPCTVGSLHDLELYHFLVARGALRHLAIRTESSQATLPAVLADSDDSEGLLSKTLFAHLKNGSGASRVQVEILELETIDLRRATKTFAKYIDISHLRELYLSGCPSTSVFLSAITKHFSNRKNACKLESFTYLLPDTDRLSHSVVEKFLQSFVGLKSLTMVGIDNMANFKMQALLKHRNTLQLLALQPDASDDRSSEHSGMTHLFYATLSKDFPNLRQLAVPMPDIQLGWVYPETSGAFDAAMTALLELPNLKTLRIFNWPFSVMAWALDGNRPDILTYLNTQFYRYELDRFAYTHLTKLINQNGRSKPGAIICFNEMSNHSIFSENVRVQLPPSVCYVQVKQCDVFGRPRIALEKMTMADARYFEPEAEIMAMPYEFQ